MTTTTIRTYSELIRLPTFEERYKYLKLAGEVGQDTFGFDRWLNQRFYRSVEWRRVRDQVVVRDGGCDLGVEDHEIFGRVLVHHMNPLDLGDIVHSTDYLLNPEYLISVSHKTHNAIHYGDESFLESQAPFAVRTPNDTCPWKNN